jgi:hypothetical protein
MNETAGHLQEAATEGVGAITQALQAVGLDVDAAVVVCIVRLADAGGLAGKAQYEKDILESMASALQASARAAGVSLLILPVQGSED